MNRNTITAEGYLPADAQVQFDQQGRARLNLRFSNQKSHKDEQTQQWVNDSEAIWFGVTVWGAEAEALADKALKGARIKASGQLVARAYTKDGEQRTSLEIEFPAVRIDPPRQQNGGGYTGSRNGDGSWTPNQGGGWNQQTGQGGFGQQAGSDPWAGQQQTFGGQAGQPTDEPPF